MRDAWTDERLDDLNNKVDRGFQRVDTEIRELRGEMNERFEQVDLRFEQMNARFDAMQRTLILSFGGIVAALIGLIVTQGLIITQI